MVSLNPQVSGRNRNVPKLELGVAQRPPFAYCIAGRALWINIKVLMAGSEKSKVTIIMSVRHYSCNGVYNERHETPQ